MIRLILPLFLLSLLFNEVYAIGSEGTVGGEVTVASGEVTVGRARDLSLSLSGGFLSQDNGDDSFFGMTSSLGLNLSPSISLELSFLNAFSKRGPTFLYLEPAWYLFAEKRLSPFLFIGAGAGINEENGATTTKGIFGAGAGIRYLFSKDLGLKMGLRHYTGGSNSDSWAISFGVLFFFDPIPEPSPIRSPTVGGTQGETAFTPGRSPTVTSPSSEVKKVEEPGVPSRKEEPKESLSVSKDNKEDGTTVGGTQGETQTLAPPPTTVTSGLKEDAKSKELLPRHQRDYHETIVNKVSPTEEKGNRSNIMELTIEFNLGETTIKDQERLLTFVKRLKGLKYRKIVIEGHACAHGDRRLNLLISKKRAYYMKRFFERHGIKKNILVRYYGEDKLRFKEIPTRDNVNDPHVRANRRVRILVIR